MDVLVVGSGSREHAIVWKLKQSKRLGKLYVAPGNPGTASIAENVPIGVMEFEKLADFAEENKIDLTIVGPDDPLGGGIVDVFKSRGLKVFGPSKAAAQIESSKTFAKQLMAEAGVPTAEFQVFKDYEKALNYVRTKGAPIVIKASGLALGKGVYVCKTIEEAEQGLKEIMLDKQFGNAGNEVVIEEFLDGQEVSIHAFCNGTEFILFPASQDHKQVGEGDTGPNTGGMGVIASVPWVTNEQLEKIGKTIVKPTLEALVAKGTPYQGVLYPGLKMASHGPKVLEFNARFGQPECEVYMRLLKTDLLDICEAIVDGKLPSNVEWNSGHAANIILASDGYPGSYKKGLPITGIENAEQMEGIVVFYAGTKEQNGQLVTNGGRVLAVTATGNSLKEALDKAYAAAKKIHFEGKYLRRDIGAKALSQKSV
ncbi:phosphoribosylamine--glycine ligase [Candidatus Parcubacteria bacterium]|nr:MAG: phosphoribosylamine--glycine ligase [Candidatus Parcubacteria bacterium]